ncbi:FAD-dependent monooxygenase [Streptomyces sp. H27-S2]|uniref:FAD-dependent monooxygenase n=1 Tax=Streptomyces antarcticus TaxID=2996458 RepID=UPI002270D36E|nr:FAD-dependent monooxygenase [Streptomyces sp. H27-S2]
MTDPAELLDVVVVGAGPTGLLLAGDLAAAGLAVTLVERRPRTAANLTRAFAVHARTLELLDARGLADELVSTGRRIDRVRPFEGMILSLQRLRSRYPFVLITPQYETEKLLERRALSTGVDIRYDCELVGLHQDRDSVTLDLRTTSPNTPAHTTPSALTTPSTLHARHAVGADGVRSTVRQALGLPFPGAEAVVRSMVLADVRLTDPPADLLAANGNAEAFAFVVPFGDGWYRVIGWHRDGRAADTDPVGLDELRSIARTALGTDHGMHAPRWISRFHSDERQVPHYRCGRVFLAGDAAHVHSPAGGLGMNTGLQDAANLSWKLAAALLGRSPDPEALLDSYHRERHPVGRLVLRVSGALVRTVTASGPARRAGGVLAAVLPHLPRPDALLDRALGVISGVGLSYPPPSGTRRPAGRRAPDLALADGHRLYAALRTGGFVLITPPGPATPPGTPLTHLHWPADRPRTDCVLVRPDGYVAWSAPRATTPELAAAVASWLLPGAAEPRGPGTGPGPGPGPQKA